MDAIDNEFDLWNKKKQLFEKSDQFTIKIGRSNEMDINCIKEKLAALLELFLNRHPAETGIEGDTISQTLEVYLNPKTLASNQADSVDKGKWAQIF